MEINRIMQQSDALFAEGKGKEAAEYLENQLRQAKDAGRWGVELPILSELMGYYRSKSLFDQALPHAERAMMLIRREELEDTVAAATTYLNVASVYRAMGNPVKAMELYLQTEKIYQAQNIHGNLLSGLYNNMFVAAMDLKEPELAAIYGEKAVEAISESDNYGQASGIIYSNLAGYFLQCDPERLDEAEEYLDRSQEMFEEYCPDDPHFGSVLAMQAYVMNRKDDLEGAAMFYRAALEKIFKTYGKNKDFELLLKNCCAVYDKMGKPEEAEWLLESFQ